MFCMGRSRSFVAVVAVAAIALTTAPAAFATGPIQSGLGKPVAVTTLKPGVTLTQYRVVVLDAGVLRTQRIYKVVWTMETRTSRSTPPLSAPTTRTTSRCA